MRSRIRVATWCAVFLATGISARCEEPSETYIPLKEGMVWKYQVSLDQKPAGQTTTVSNLPSRNLKGKTVTPVQAPRGITFLVTDDTGTYDFAQQSPADFEPKVGTPPYDYEIKEPIKPGTTWTGHVDTGTSGSNQMLVTVNCSIRGVDETVTVPAGTFTRCVRVDCSGVTNGAHVELHHWLAPGVGLVRAIEKQWGIGPAQDVGLQLESVEK